uniref:Sodium/calcium exchanger membrane region domain-containing protein n=1 Tax=Eutreptiella gymnastica TaxID=73025 RepID=A0A7S1NV87_9EUGL|mmetsp:Transcript_93259/g.161654  ORF Transcript_93259/g.161654 Transcript_93259/m.161654 type:complete len:421 (+) Transcript_93259:32-1294(+)
MVSSKAPGDRAADTHALNVFPALTSSAAPVADVPPDYLKATSNPVTALVIFTPLGIAAYLLDWHPMCCFILNFLPIIPLAYMLAEAAQQAANSTGETVGGLITASFGNAPELILGCAALRRDKVELVQASLVGSILSTLVLMTGLCLFVGGIYHKEQTFNNVAVVANSGLLMVACMALTLPTMYVFLVPQTNNDLQLSYAAAISLAVVYVQFVYYQTQTHSHLFRDCEEDNDVPTLSLPRVCAIMTVLTMMMAVHSEALVNAVEGTVSSTGMNERFIGVVLLPIVGNSAEHVVALMAAMKNKMSLAVGIAFASCTQVALFVVPVTVFAGWLMGVKMDLSFHLFEVVVIHMSLLIVAELMRGGTGSWLQGTLLLSTYALLSFGFYYLPDSPSTPRVAPCAPSPATSLGAPLETARSASPST